MKIKSILSALLLMASSMASAQYLNVKLEDGTYRSFKTTPNIKVSFGEKAGAEVLESEQIIIVNGHTVTVKLADDTPASEVMLSLGVEEENVKIEAYSKLNHGLWCSTDDNAEVPVTSVSNSFFTFTISNIQKDMVVTVRYITVSFDLNNSGKNANFTAKPNYKKIGYNTTINEPDRPFSDKYGFRGWYKDKECTEAWNFSTLVTKSTTLYAKWAEDPTGTKINKHEFVKLGGYYWATENVGVDGYNRVYHHDVYGDLFNQCQGKSTTYNASDNNALNAAKSWGSEGNYTWTLPSDAQWQALIDYCDWTWKTDYNGTGMNGILVTGREGTYESEHGIFLPAAGLYNDASGDVLAQGNGGFYWSANRGRCLDFTNSVGSMEYSGFAFGSAVRPVLE